MIAHAGAVEEDNGRPGKIGFMEGLSEKREARQGEKTGKERGPIRKLRHPIYAPDSASPIKRKPKTRLSSPRPESSPAVF